MMTTRSVVSDLFIFAYHLKILKFLHVPLDLKTIYFFTYQQIKSLTWSHFIKKVFCLSPYGLSVYHILATAVLDN